MTDQHRPEHTAETLLDASGLMCPEPVARARALLHDMHPGERLRVVCTDPHAELDFEVFAMRSPHRLLETVRSGDRLEFLLERGEDNAGPD